jgi:hypothetical protein
VCCRYEFLQKMLLPCGIPPAPKEEEEEEENGKPATEDSD